MAMEEKAVRGVPWTFLGLAVSKTVATATTFVLARLVAPSDFGLVAIGLIAVNFLYWFGGISFGATVVVHQDLDRRQQGTVFTLALLGAAAATLVAIVLAPVAADVLHQPRLTDVLIALSASVMVGGVASFYDSLLQSQLEFRRRFAGLAVQTLSFTIVSIVLAATGAGVWSLVVGQLTSQALFAIVLVALAPQRVVPRWDRAIAKRVFSTGQGFFTQGVTVFIRQNADTVIVGRAFNAAAVGYYSMAFRLGDLTYSALADPIARVTFPAFARSHARQEDVRPIFLRVLKMVALVTVPVGVIMSAAADPFTHALFGDRWAAMIGPLTVVGIWAAVRPVEGTMSWLLNSLGRAGAVGWVALVVLFPLAIGLVFAVRSDDLALVACVPLGDTLISMAILTLLLRKHAEMAPARLWQALVRIFACGGVMWVVTRLMVEVLSGTPAFVALVGVSACGLLVYVAGIWLFERSLVHMTFGALARVAGRGGSAAPAPATPTPTPSGLPS